MSSVAPLEPIAAFFERSLSLRPIGALEMGPRGTHFVRYDQLPRLLGP
jgi:hypothetical protein